MISTQDQKPPLEDCGGKATKQTTQKFLLETAIIPPIIVSEPDSYTQQFSASTYAALALELMDTQSPRPKPSEASPKLHVKEPARKRQKLEDASPWIDQALQRGRLERSRSGQPDPFPFPEGYGPLPHEKRFLPVPIKQRQHSHRPVGHSEVSPFPARGLHIPPHSRRSSSVTSATGFTGSPALSHGSIVSASRYGITPPGSFVEISGRSELDLESREGSVPLDHGDITATFERIHNVPHVMLEPRQTMATSKFEQLPQGIFMRVMMYCEYKEQVRLKQCNYNFYWLVDLDAIPWRKKTQTILEEERDNPINFVTKAPKTRDKDIWEVASGNYGDDGVVSDGESKATTRRIKFQRSQKTKPDPGILGKWGCYTCYKILPPQYFEGPLLEDKQGRTAKNQRTRGPDATDPDKKVDMRVEYVQIIGAITARPLPAWLETDDKEVEASDVETYVRHRMAKGVDRDDLRAYYEDIINGTHLMAPLRGVTPVFVEAAHGIPQTIVNDLMPDIRNANADLENPIETKSYTFPFSSVSADEIPPGCKTYRPLYRQGAKMALRGDAEVGRYFYELFIPNGSTRDKDYLLLPNSRPTGRVILPQRASWADADYIERPVIEVDDVFALRRICIPCGTKYGVYRRDCNRKIVSKTGEGWWVCGCPKVRQTGRSRGCPDCGRRTIY